MMNLCILKRRIGQCFLPSKKFTYVIAKSLIYTIVLFFVSYVIGLKLETNDDSAIQWFLSRGDNVSIFQNKILCKALGVLYDSFPRVEWWAVVTTALTIVSIYSLFIVFFLVQPSKSIFFNAVTELSLIVFLYGVCLKTINWTRNAYIISFAGAMLCVLVLSVINRNEVNRKIPKFQMILLFFGISLLVIGGMIRKQCSIIATFFGVVTLILIVVYEKSKITVNFVVIWGFLIMIIAGSFSFFTNYFLLDNSEKYYYDYLSYRSAISDYRDSLPEYIQSEEVFSQAHISQLAYENFDVVSEDTDMWSIDNLQLIFNMSQYKIDMSNISNSLWRYFSNTGFKQYLWLINLLLAQVFILCNFDNKCRCRLFLCAIDGILLFLISAVVLRGHAVVRAIEPLFFFAYFGFYMTVIRTDSIDYQDKSVISNGISPMKSNDREFGNESALVRIIIGITTILVNVILLASQMKLASSYCYIPTKTQYEKVKLMDYIDADREDIYIFPLDNLPAWWTRTFGYWERQPENYCMNLFCTGGWDARAPYNIDRLKNYGIDNPIKAIYERDDVISTYSSTLLMYLRETYNDSICVSVVKKIGNTEFVRYIAFDPNISMDNQRGKVIFREKELDSKDGKLEVYALIDELDLEKIKDVYCIVNDGDRYERYVFGSPNQDGWMYMAMYGVESIAEIQMVYAEMYSGELIEIEFDK